MTPEEIAWVSGILEGEGSFGVYRKQCIVQLNMTDEDIVTRVCDIFGVGTVKEYNHTQPNRKDFWKWRIGHAHDVLFVLKTILPWLGRRRSARAREVIKAAEKIDPNNRARGEDHPHTTLTKEEVVEIKRALKEGSVTQRNLAHRYSVSENTISSIKHGRTWAHVSTS